MDRGNAKTEYPKVPNDKICYLEEKNLQMVDDNGIDMFARMKFINIAKTFLRNKIEGNCQNHEIHVRIFDLRRFAYAHVFTISTFKNN